jgi:hypothetical protein
MSPDSFDGLAEMEQGRAARRQRDRPNHIKPKKDPAELQAKAAAAAAEATRLTQAPAARVIDESGKDVEADGEVSLAEAFARMPPREVSKAEGDLTPQEQERLALCHRAFANYAEAEAIAIIAMMTVRNERLYRQTHKTFEAFVEEVWQEKKSWVDRRIGQLEVTRALGLEPIGSKLVPESQARELTGLLNEKGRGESAVREVWEQAHKESDKVTAKVLREVRDRLYPRPENTPGRAALPREVKLVRQLGQSPTEIASTLRAGLDEDEFEELADLLTRS